MASYPMPYPLRRGEYDDSSQFRNPAGTQPFPQPGDMPVGMWQGEEQRIEFRTAGTPPYGFPNLGSFSPDGWALWSSPVFDLQPELRGMSNNTSNMSEVAGRPTLRGYGAVPIWGSGGKLLRVSFQKAPANIKFMILTYEEGHVIDPARVTPITPLPGQDITAQYQTGAAPANLQTYNVTLNFAPFGGGMRYWRCNLLFLWLPFGVGADDPQTFNLQPVYY